MKQITRSTLPLFLAAAPLALAFQARALTNYWINPGEGPWNEPTNWSRGVVLLNDEARIGNGGTALIDDSQIVITGFAVMGDTNLTRGTLRMTGGSLSTTADIRVGGTTLASGSSSTGQ